MVDQDRTVAIAEPLRSVRLSGDVVCSPPRGPTNGKQETKHSRYHDPEPVVTVFDPKQFDRIVGVDVTVINGIADAIEPVLFRLYSEAFEDMLIAMVWETYL